MQPNNDAAYRENSDAQYKQNRKPRVRVLPMLLLGILPMGIYADATAPCNTGAGLNSTECGVNATASSVNSTSVGASAAATGTAATAAGRSAIASGTSSTAVGVSAAATQQGALALGNFSGATAGLASAVGAGAQANSEKTTSMGYAAGFNGGVFVTDSPGSIALGYFANISPASPGAIAIGASDGPPVNSTIGAQATGENAIAIGFEARANQAGAIALGANVVADKAHTMTVGVPIEVRRDDGSTQVRVNEKSAGNAVRTLFNVVCDTCTPGFRFNQLLPSNNTWNFRMLQSGAFSVDDPATPGKEAEFRSGGDLRISGTLFESSSRAVKSGIRELEGTEVLSRLERLPVSEWSYKKDNGRVRHIGPMAEDFHALFKVGVDSRSISSLDTSGVALAAIKSLHRTNQRLLAETIRLRSEAEYLKAQNDQFKTDTNLAMAVKEEHIARLSKDNIALNHRLSIIEARLAEMEDMKRLLMSMANIKHDQDAARQLQN